MLGTTIYTDGCQRSRQAEELDACFDLAYFNDFLGQRKGKGLLHGFTGSSVEFAITLNDLGRSWNLCVREGVLVDFCPGRMPGGKAEFFVDSRIFEEIVSGRTSPQKAYLSGKAEIKGDLLGGLRIARMLAEFFTACPYVSGNTQNQQDKYDDVFQEMLDVKLEGGVSTAMMAAYDDNTDCSRIVVVFPPHPLLGGNADNNLVRSICKQTVSAGCLAITFNYRGVCSGKEIPAYWKEMEERKDYSLISRDSLLVVRHALLSFCRGASLYYAGYSFGSLVALTLNKELKARSMALVSPPIYEYEFESLFKGNGHLAVMASAEDSFCPSWKVKELAGRHGFKFIESGAVDHFYRGGEEYAAERIIDNLEVKI